MTKVYFTLFFSLLNFSLAWCQWTTLNPMNSVRTSHVSAIFSNGTVLVAGGRDLSGQVKSAEMYDFSSESWTSTSSEMTHFHSSGTATTIAADKVLVAGGWTGIANTNKCEIYDLTNDIWTSADSLNFERSDHTATLLQNGKILVVGGYNGTINLSSCEIYDPIGNSWSIAGSLNTGRSSHTATLLNDGRVLVSGGYNPDAGFQLNSTEIYDPIADSWTNGPVMNVGRNLHGASLLADGNVLISGGETFTGAVPYAFEGSLSVEIFNATNNTFSAAQSLPAGLCYHEQITFGNYVMAIGGREKTDYAGGNFTSLPGKTYLYDVLNNSWQEKAMNLDSRIYFSALLTMDGKVMVAGGETSSVELYDPSAGILSLDKDLPFSMYPNPAQTSISLSLKKDFKPASLKIVDVSGRTVLETSGNYSNIDISDLQAGIYYLELDSNGELFSEKFVKN